MKNTFIKICGFLVLLSLLPVLTQEQNTLPTVVSIGDGDTLRLRQAGMLSTIRLGCMDAPETTQQPYGQQSTARLKQLLPIGTTVEVREITRDHYGRTVAEIYVNKQSVNLQMVREGQAAVFHQYLSGCSEVKHQYLQAQSQAIAKKLGFWNQRTSVKS